MKLRLGHTVTLAADLVLAAFATEDCGLRAVDTDCIDHEDDVNYLCTNPKR